MRYLGRMLFIFLMLISSIVVGGVTILWARSYGGMDRAAHGSGQAHWSVTSMSGRIALFYRSGFEVGRGWSFDSIRGPTRWITDGALGMPWYHVFGFSCAYSESDRPRGRGTDLPIVVPHWFIALVTAPLPAIGWLRGYRWAKRRHVLSRVTRGLCGQCGYDLRATPTRCPECGARTEGDARFA